MRSSVQGDPPQDRLPRSIGIDEIKSAGQSDVLVRRHAVVAILELLPERAGRLPSQRLEYHLLDAIHVLDHVARPLVDRHLHDHLDHLVEEAGLQVQRLENPRELPVLVLVGVDDDFAAAGEQALEERVVLQQGLSEIEKTL